MSPRSISNVSRTLEGYLHIPRDFDPSQLGLLIWASHFHATNVLQCWEMSEDSHSYSSYCDRSPMDRQELEQAKYLQ